MKANLLTTTLLSLLLLISPSFSDEPTESHLPRFPMPLAVNLSLEASLFTGEAVNSVPIELPESAGDIQEKLDLELRYRSGSGGGWAGKGWEMDLGYVAKVNKFGSNHPNNPYMLMLNGSSYELVSIGNNEYRTRIEENLRIVFNDSLWRVWTKEGTEYKFEIFAGGKWYLTKVTDTHSLSIAIEYDKLSNEEVYLKEIRYPEGAGLSPYCKINFLSENREDKLISYYYGSPFRINRRLSEIQIFVEGYLQYKYLLNYTTNGISQGSLLASVVYSGKDGSSLPPTSFSYAPANPQDVLDSPATWLANTGELYTHHYGDDFHDLTNEEFAIPKTFDVAVVDLNGDGLADFVGCKYIRKFLRTFIGEMAFETEWLVRLGTKQGFSPEAQVWLERGNSYFKDDFGRYGSITLGKNAALVDMDGDGLLDLAYSKYGGVLFNAATPLYDIMVRLNTGSKFSDEEIKWLDHSQAYFYNTNSAFAYRFKLGSTVFLADMNGDGKADLIYYRRANSPVRFSCDNTPPVTTYIFDVFSWVVRLNTGNGFSPEEKIWLEPEKSYFKYCRSYAYQPIHPSSSKVGRLEHLRWADNATLVDVNHDGLLDLVYNDFAAEKEFFQSDSFYVYHEPAYSWKVRYNTGEKFSDQPITLLNEAPVFFYKQSGDTAPYYYLSSKVKIGENGILSDLNNDGLVDLVFNKYADGPVFRQFNTTTRYPSCDWRIRYNSGEGFAPEQEYLLSESLDHKYDRDEKYANVVTSNSLVTDLNADGLADIIYPYLLERKDIGGIASATFDWKARLNKNDPALDLLVEETNLYGGKTKITYSPSSSFQNKNLPFVLPLVKTITNDPGIGNAGTTTYDYEGGWYDFPSREFRGFRRIKTTDPLNYTSLTYFHQDDSKLGKIEKEENQIKRNLYIYKEDSSPPYFTPLIQVDEHTDSKSSKTAYESDDYGNIIKTIFYGDTDVAGDKKSIFTDYALNTSSWLFLPSRERTFSSLDGSGPLISETQYLYDRNSNYTDTPIKGDLTTLREYLNTKNIYLETILNYDSYGNEIARTDPRGYTTKIDYDLTYHAFPILITNPKEHQEKNTYYLPWEDKGPFGNLKSKTDPNGNETAFEYDGFGRKTKVTGPLDMSSAYGSESYEYSLSGPGANYILTRTTEEHGSSAHFIRIDFLDGFGKIIQSAKESEAEGTYSYVTTEYNPRGEIERAYLPYFKDGGLPAVFQSPAGSAEWIQNTYDALGRLTLISKPDGSSITNSYNGWTTTATDENSHQRFFVKDAYGRLSQVKEKNGPEEYTTNYQYDGLDNLIVIADHFGNKAEFFYDSIRRKTKMIDPDLGSWTYEYDHNTNLIQTQDANGKTINYAYDELNRLFEKNYLKYPGIEISYKYDEAASLNGIGRRTSMQDLSGQSRWDYDKEGRIIKLEKTIDEDVYSLEWDYDALDRVKSTTFPNQKRIAFRYNNSGAIESIDDFILNVDYNASSQPISVSFGGSIISQFDYYPENQRLRSILSGSLQDLSYEYDKAGNITKISDAVHSRIKEYVYDDIDRLLSGDGNAYEYNAIGNIIKRNGLIQSYSSSKIHALNNDGISSYSYDSCGNMIRGAGRVIDYDPENRPILITKDGITTQFVYDGDGKRAKKTVKDSKSITTTIYIENLYEKESTQ